MDGFVCIVSPSIILSLTEMTLATWAHSITRPDSYAYTYASVNACRRSLACMRAHIMNPANPLWGNHRVRPVCKVNAHAWCRSLSMHALLSKYKQTDRHTLSHTLCTFLNVFVGHSLNNLPIPLAYSPSSNTHSSLGPTPDPHPPFCLPHPSSLPPPCPC